MCDYYIIKDTTTTKAYVEKSPTLGAVQAAVGT
jgi:hypothetical protein